MVMHTHQLIKNRKIDNNLLLHYAKIESLHLMSAPEELCSSHGVHFRSAAVLLANIFTCVNGYVQALKMLLADFKVHTYIQRYVQIKNKYTPRLHPKMPVLFRDKSVWRHYYEIANC